MHEHFWPNVAHLFSIQLCTNMLLPAVFTWYTRNWQIHNFQERISQLNKRNGSESTAKKSLTKDSWSPNSPDLNPLHYHMWGAMFEKFRQLKPHNVTDLKRRCRLSGTICLIKQLANMFRAFANQLWHASKLKADIRTLD